nr:DUF2252 family protein [Mycobacterium asiaticum]
MDHHRGPTLHRAAVPQPQGLHRGQCAQTRPPRRLRPTGRCAARAAHSRSIDPRLLAGYCGDTDELDDALTAYATAYADQTESDHAQLTAAVNAGTISATADC